MSGLRCLDGDVGGFQIAHLAHHHNVRVLSQKGPQGHSKTQAGFVLHIDLVDARKLDFARVFDCGDVHLGGVEQVQACVEGLRLARAGGAGHQHQSVRCADRGQQALEIFGLVTQLAKIQLDLQRVQYSDHQFFTEQGRQGAHAQVQLPA